MSDSSSGTLDARIRADSRLGTVRDSTLAAEHGCSRQHVGAIRKALGIPAWSPPRRVRVPKRIPVSAATRRRLIVALALTDRTRADIARAVGWTPSQLARKLAPLDAGEHDGRMLYAADVALLATAIGTTPEAIDGIDVEVGDEAALFALLGAEGFTLPADRLSGHAGGARLLALGLVSRHAGPDLGTLTPTGRRAAVK